ncbi:MAG: FxsA family protein [Arcobacteraceae bacterium]|nr:FxsA family protein [Arcobacteraceae bacterium]
MIYIFLYLFLEVMVTTYFASMLGGFFTFLEIIITAFIGGFLLKNFKYSLMLNIKALTKREITQEEFIKQNVANAIGAILLIIPGFLTDIVGVLLQFGILTRVLTKIFKFKIAPKNTQNEPKFHYQEENFTYKQKRRYDDDEIIDVEIIDDSRTINH